mmetsp:Transcript_35151/g.34168  ORF Transcript_35151/g.34168 Transcript_35151/m.34168 type:complete len:111 (+) Transcript_35151:1489-1821(+)
MIEEGRYPTMAEIAVRVAMFTGEVDIKQFYVNADITVKAFKEIVGKEYKESDMTKFTFWRVDAFEEPVTALRRDQGQLTKMNVSSGDLLILKSDAVLTNDEKLFINIHLT